MLNQLVRIEIGGVRIIPSIVLDNLREYVVRFDERDTPQVYGVPETGVSPDELADCWGVHDVERLTVQA
jgi:hypothetical protein